MLNSMLLTLVVSSMLLEQHAVILAKVNKIILAKVITINLASSQIDCVF